MTPLETRLRSLRQLRLPPAPVLAPVELRRRSAARGRRRLFTAAAVAVPFLAVALAVFVAAEEPGDRVVDEPSSTTRAWDVGSNRSLGDIDGVRVDVSPRTGLRDGDLVEVRVEGLERIVGAQILMCAGDVDEADPAASCTTGAVGEPGSESIGPVVATAEQTVSVPRFIRISRGTGDPNTRPPYDCATEPAGCVLAVGPYQLPARAVLVPLTFVDEPVPEPGASITPSDGLAERQTVTLTAEGLRPNGAFFSRQCQAAPSNRCDEHRWPTVRADESGSLTAEVTVLTAIYDQRGRIDCVTSPCAVVLGTDEVDRAAEVPFRFAAGVTASVPELRLDPPGPYVDGQTVTVEGTGFPPSFDVVGNLGQCPADKDTAVEERCAYPLTTPVIVEADGTFTMPVQLSASLASTGTCVTGPGCVLAWVLNHGPIAASVPLDFSP
jgi:hypothetical protein